MDPIAPSSALSGNNLTLGGVMPPSQTTVSTAPTDLSSQYEMAVRSADPGQLKQVAVNAIGTPFEKHANDSAKIAEKNQSEYQQKLAPVVSNLTSGDPEKRLEAVKDFETINDHPKWGQWLVAVLTGNPNAHKLINGGAITYKNEIGNDGKMYKIGRNELGEPTSAINTQTNQPISQESFGRLQIGLPKTEENQKLLAELSTKAKAKEDEKVAAYSGLADNSEILGKITQDLNDKIASHYGLSPEKMREVIGTASSSYESNKQITSTIDKLNSDSYGHGSKFTDEDIKGLQGSFGLGKIGISADGKKITVNGQDASQTQLDQIQRHLADIKSRGAHFNVNQEGSAAYEIFKNLSAQEQAQVVELKKRQAAYYELENEIKQKHGSLPFLTPTSAFDYLQNSNATDAQAKTLQSNAQSIRDFSNYRQKQIEANDNQPLQPGALEQGFLNSDTHKNRARLLKEILTESLNRPVANIKDNELSGATLSGAMGRKEDVVSAEAKPVEPPKKTVGVAPTKPKKEAEKPKLSAQEILARNAEKFRKEKGSK